MSHLLDTNVLSELLRPAPSPRVLAWFGAQRNESLFVSALTQAEMLLGAALLPSGRRRKELEAGLAAMFESEFAGRVLPFDGEAARAYAVLVARRREVGRPIPAFDAQIAAIARARGMRVATRNGGDFEHCGVELLDPWA